MNHIKNAVEKYSSLILATERYLWAHPETGYKEYKTNEYLVVEFERLGYKLERADGITGFYTTVDTGREGPEVLILAELDSIICPSHPEADRTTGAVHSCGHHAQCAALLGVAAALTDKDVLSKLSGRIRLCAVPAEELLEIEYRQGLRERGVIKYLGGKSEFLSRGYFDGVDIALMVHTTVADNPSVRDGSVGCLAKHVTYKGRAAHAGGSPWNGINALYAANCGLNAVNAIRETFAEENYIRVHPIITRGGDMVNAIPAEVEVESYVRGATFEAISAANKKVNRALVGAALSIGANVEVIDMPGYSPLRNDPGMMELAREAAELALPEVKFRTEHRIGTGSTDMGDLSCIMPVVHPYMPGAVGTSHGSDYRIADPTLACIKCAEWQVTMLTLLLGDGAKRAKRIIDEFKPQFASAREFLDYQDSLNDSGDRIIYGDSGEAQVRYE